MRPGKAAIRCICEGGWQPDGGNADFPAVAPVSASAIGIVIVIVNTLALTKPLRSLEIQNGARGIIFPCEFGKLR